MVRGFTSDIVSKTAGILDVFQGYKQKAGAKSPPDVDDDLFRGSLVMVIETI